MRTYCDSDHMMFVRSFIHTQLDSQRAEHGPLASCGNTVVEHLPHHLKELRFETQHENSQHLDTQQNSKNGGTQLLSITLMFCKV